MVDYQELVDGIYSAFGTPVTLSDAQQHLIAFSAQPSHLTDSVRRDTVLAREATADSASITAFAHRQTTISRFLAPEDSGLFDRLIVPLTVPSGAVGFLFLIDPEHRIDVTDLETFGSAFEEVALRIELELFSRPQIEASVRVLLTSDDAQQLERAARHIENTFPGRFDSGARILAVDTPGTGAVSPWIRELGFRTPWATIGDKAFLVVPNRDDSLFGAPQRRSSAEARPRAAVGRSVPQLSAASRSATDALRALRLARDRSFSPGTNPLVWDDLGPWRILLSAYDDEGSQTIDPRVGRMIADQDETTLRMIRMHLEPGNGSDDIASEFHMHRTTLYSRLRRVQVDFGLDWTDPDDRLSTVLGLRLAKLVEQPAVPPLTPAPPHRSATSS